MIHPTNDHVLVRLIKREEVSEGGIVLPDSRKHDKMPDKGTIEGAGPKSDYLNQVGLTVVFSGYAAHEVEEDLLIIQDENIMAVID